MTRDEKRAYSRGYYAGSCRAWPAYHPPSPPEKITAAVIEASQALALRVAQWCGAFGDDDEFSKELLPLIDAVDKAQSDLTEWLKRPAQTVRLTVTGIPKLSPGQGADATKAAAEPVRRSGALPETESQT